MHRASPSVTYALYAAIVMPDHVHMIATPHEEWALPRILRRVKGASARRVNTILNRTGSLWQDESFDRTIRDDEDLRAKAEYVLQNAARAGLGEWRWIWRQWIEGADPEA